MGKTLVLYFSLTFLSATLGFTLVDLNGDQVEYWVDRLETSDPIGREEAAHHLGQLGASARDAVPALAKAKKHDSSEYVRRAAADALQHVQVSAGPAAPR
jgi:HEAT repeat protein